VKVTRWWLDSTFSIPVVNLASHEPSHYTDQPEEVAS
jgi:hypothetical protein